MGDQPSPKSGALKRYSGCRNVTKWLACSMLQGTFRVNTATHLGAYDFDGTTINPAKVRQRVEPLAEFAACFAGRDEEHGEARPTPFSGRRRNGVPEQRRKYRDDLAPSCMQGHEPASARMGYEDGAPFSRWYRRCERPAGRDAVARWPVLLGRQ